MCIYISKLSKKKASTETFLLYNVVFINIHPHSKGNLPLLDNLAKSLQ